MKKSEILIQKIELDYLEHVESDLEKRKLLLPLTKKTQIKALMWNLLYLKKYSCLFSYNDYSEIVDIWLSRIK